MRVETGAAGARYLKGGRSVLCRRVKERYAFIKARQQVYPVKRLCLALDVHPSGYYAWLKHPVNSREQRDQQLLISIKQFWLESGGHYGYRNIHLDLQAAIDCGRDRVLRLMQQAGIKAERGYKPPRGVRRISWHPMSCSVSLQLRARISGGSAMSRKGNCWDNAVAESFFSNLKKEKIRRVKYKTRDDARQAMFHYIEMFYNPKRRHTSNDRVSPADYERQYFRNQESV